MFWGKGIRILHSILFLTLSKPFTTTFLNQKLKGSIKTSTKSIPG
jgi:hypothetical protein